MLLILEIAAGVALGLIVFDDLKKHADELKVSVLTLVWLLAIHIPGRFSRMVDSAGRSSRRSSFNRLLSLFCCNSC